MTQKEARKIMLWKAIERYRTAGGREEHHAYKDGMTLRDYFAGKAMVMALDYWRRVGCEEGCTPQPDYDFRWDTDRITSDCKEVAELSYVMADAMLCARKLPSNAI